MSSNGHSRRLQAEGLHHERSNTRHHELNHRLTDDAGSESTVREGYILLIDLGLVRLVLYYVRLILLHYARLILSYVRLILHYVRLIFEGPL